MDTVLLLRINDLQELTKHTIALLKDLPVTTLPLQPYPAELAAIDATPLPTPAATCPVSLQAHVMWRLIARVMDLNSRALGPMADGTIVLYAAGWHLRRARQRLAVFCADTLTLLTATPAELLRQYPVELLYSVAQTAEMCCLCYPVQPRLPARGMLGLASGERGLDAVVVRTRLIAALARLVPTPQLDDVRQLCRCLVELPHADHTFLARALAISLQASDGAPANQPYLYHLAVHRLLTLPDALLVVLRLAHVLRHAGIWCLESAGHALTEALGRRHLTAIESMYTQLLFHAYMEQNQHFRRFIQMADESAGRIWRAVVSVPSMALYQPIPLSGKVQCCPLAATALYWPVTLPSQRNTPVCMETIIHQAMQTNRLRDYFTNQSIEWSDVTAFT
jgi:hypothetical protein